MTRLRNICFMLILIFAGSCATMVPPKGGPRDTEPPVVEETSPPNESVNLQPQQIRIRFNEFVQLNDVQNQVLISPPVKDKPVFQLKGKSLVFDLPEKLKENTTYNIFFGSAVQDLNEGNPMNNLSYTFSTGPYLDSLFLSGHAKNALSGETEKGWLIMLYREHGDSLPYKKVPFYITKTDEHGYFRFENLAPGSYKIFGIKDENSNYLYDPYDEAISFSDTLIQPFEPVQLPDSLLKDSLLADTVNLDSLRYKTAQKGVHLSFFKEIDTVQSITDKKALNPFVYQYVFRYPTKKIQVRSNPKVSFHQSLNSTKDTLKLFFEKAVDDSLQFYFSDTGFAWSDTIWTEPKKTKEKKTYSIQSNLKHGLLPYFKKASFQAPIPFQTIHDSLIIVKEKQDSLFKSISGTVYFQDTVLKNIVLADFEFNADYQYRLTALPGAMILADSSTHDTLSFDFEIKGKEKYGNIIFELLSPDSSMAYIIQLLDNNQEVVKQQHINGNQEVKFEHLNPNTYGIRVIEDNIPNGVWDTGIYSEGRHPERSWIFHKQLNVRANWDISERMDLTELHSH
ncbi:MAG: Ig-like domain-containing protein [Bacteroidales bacterium]